jgi:ABC-type antimicrobial peptide transport system permease subunit
MVIVIRGAVPVTTLAPAVRRVIGILDPLLPVSNMRTMDDVIDESLAPPRFTSELLSFLGVLGLALAVIGIYGVIAYFVAQRTFEIGIRMALGADGSRVLGMVVRQGLALAALGIAFGTAASLVFTSVLANQLYGVTARDPWTFVVVGLLLGIVAIAATIIPARRAARVDPILALRAP